MNVQETIDQVPLAILCYRLKLSAEIGGTPINNLERTLLSYAETAFSYSDNNLTIVVSGAKFDLSEINCDERDAVKNFLKQHGIRDLVTKEQYRYIKDDLIQITELTKMVNDLVATFGQFIEIKYNN
ncbi:hypothetical protein HWA77_16830 [Photobacterium damselae subsp. damselae]|uniref:Uncharacterized protein n=1 Tax=Photobacterium damselae subsp. damselae TaxID=85581 RepID=A0A850R4F7_PHODD|nr:hypothetical protein [Photobacterium damselae subsp. damselae]